MKIERPSVRRSPGNEMAPQCVDFDGFCETASLYKVIDKQVRQSPEKFPRAFCWTHETVPDIYVFPFS